MFANKTKKVDQFFDLIKWLIGTVGLGITGICINHEVQQTELQIKRLEADANFLKVVTQGVDTRTANNELSYLEYVYTFITTSEIKNDITLRIESLRGFIKETGRNEAKNLAVKQEEQLSNQLSESQTKTFRAKQGDERTLGMSAAQVSIDVLKKEESEIAGNVVLVDSGVMILNKIQKEITPISIVENRVVYTLIGAPTTKWCKKGYYIDFNNTLRIGILDLSSNSVSMNISDIEGEHAPELFADNKMLAEGDVFRVERSHYQYEITFNYTASAGKNPFTKAAYLTVSIYRKNSVL